MGRIVLKANRHNREIDIHEHNANHEMMKRFTCWIVLMIMNKLRNWIKTVILSQVKLFFVVYIDMVVFNDSFFISGKNEDKPFQLA